MSKKSERKRARSHRLRRMLLRAAEEEAVRETADRAKLPSAGTICSPWIEVVDPLGILRWNAYLRTRDSR